MAEGEWRLGHRPGLDQLRGIAVLLVVVGHSLIGWPVLRAPVGVVIFFVLSGFLITRLLVERPPALREFYARRARRLLPALPLAFAMFALVNALLGLPVLRPLIAAATYSLNYARVGEEFGAFSHLWSLAVEEHFYLLWPPVLLALPRTWIIRSSVAAIIAIAVARVAIGAGSDYAYSATHLRVDAILIGSLLALVVTSAPTRWLTISSWVVIALAGSAAVDRHLTQWGLTIAALASAVLVRSALDWKTRRPMLERIGRISYGIYLFHIPVAMLTWGLPGPVVVLIVGSTSVLLAELSWRVIESPFLQGRPAPDAAARIEQGALAMVASR